MTGITPNCGFGSPLCLSARFQKRYKMTLKGYRKNVG